jgi:hypothetical protein
MASLRGSHRPLALGWIVVSVASLTAATATAATDTSPTTLANRALTAATRQRSVHYELHTTRGNGSQTTMICDVGRSSGLQRIRFSRGAQTGNVRIRIVARTAYVRGDAFALNSYMGFHEAASQKYANRWIKIPSSNRAYLSIAFAATLATELDHIRFVSVDPPVLPGRIAGQSVLVIRGTRSAAPLGTALLYVRKGRTTLPVAARVTAFSGATYTTVFSRWNEGIHVTAPVHPVPMAATNLE